MQARDSRISKDFIMENIGFNYIDSQIKIFEKYLQIPIYELIQTKEMFCNPMRADDFPTCTFKVFDGKHGSKLWFRDWSDIKGYDCFDLVQHLAKCDFNQALELIALHFSLLSVERIAELKYVLSPTNILKLNRKQSTMNENTLQIKSEPWKKATMDYYRQYHLTGEDLGDNVIPIYCYWYNGNKFYPPKGIGFAYMLNGKPFKIVCPFADKTKNEIRFLHVDASIIQGEKDLLFNKRILLATSSLKDVLLLRKIARLYNLDFEAIATMSETTPLAKEKFNYFQARYSYVVYYLNNDSAGKLAAQQQAEQFQTLWFCNPDNFPKDPSDLAKEYGLTKATEIIEELIFNIIPPF